MKLYELHHDPNVPKSRRKRMWCGPSAIGALTGVSIECATDWIKECRGRPVDRKGREIGVKGVGIGIVHDVLWNLGYDCRLQYVDKHTTLARFLRERTAEMYAKAFLIGAGGHWLTVLDSVGVDSAVGPNIIGLRNLTKRRGRIRHGVHAISEREGEVAAAIRAIDVEPYPAIVRDVRMSTQVIRAA